MGRITKDIWVEVHAKAPAIAERIIYSLVEKSLFGNSKEDNNIAIEPFLRLLEQETGSKGIFDLSSDKTRLEAICMQNSITLDECLEYIKEFNDFNKSRCLTHRDFKDAFTHFSNWLKKQVKPEKPNNAELKKTATKEYRFFLEWVESQAPYCFNHMVMPTEREFEQLKKMGIGGNVVGEIIRKIENNRVLRSRRDYLYPTIIEVNGII